MTHYFLVKQWNQQIMRLVITKQQQEIIMTRTDVYEISINKIFPIYYEILYQINNDQFDAIS